MNKNVYILVAAVVAYFLFFKKSEKNTETKQQSKPDTWVPIGQPTLAGNYNPTEATRGRG